MLKFGWILPKIASLHEKRIFCDNGEQSTKAAWQQLSQSAHFSREEGTDSKQAPVLVEAVLYG